MKQQSLKESTSTGFFPSDCLPLKQEFIFLFISPFLNEWFLLQKCSFCKDVSSHHGKVNQTYTTAYGCGTLPLGFCGRLAAPCKIMSICSFPLWATWRQVLSVQKVCLSSSLRGASGICGEEKKNTLNNDKNRSVYTLSTIKISFIQILPDMYQKNPKMPHSIKIHI